MANTIKVHKTPVFSLSPSDFTQLVKDMTEGKVGAIMFMGVNPAYSYPDSKAFEDAMKAVAVKVSFSEAMDETGKAFQTFLLRRTTLMNHGQIAFMMGRSDLHSASYSAAFRLPHGH